MTTDAALLEVEDLVVSYRVGRERVEGVASVSLAVSPGETLGIVGESGSGKSTLARGIMQLETPESGSVRLAGEELTGHRGADLADRRAPMQMVFQDPMSASNPRRTVLGLVTEGLRIRGEVPSERHEELAREVLRRVELDPDRFGGRRIHELSGGQRQRVSIARALILEPRVLLCDEIVSALDVSVQAQLLNLLLKMQADTGISLLFIAHDLAVVRHISDRVLVLYAGRVCEIGPADEIFDDPQHPYTQLLMRSIPVPDPTISRPAAVEAPSDPASALRPSTGCRFRNRCPAAHAPCETIDPPLVAGSDGRSVACHLVNPPT